MDTNPRYKVLARNMIEAVKALWRGYPLTWVSRKDGLWYVIDREMGLYFCTYWRGRDLYAKGVRARLDDLCGVYGIDPTLSFSETDIVVDVWANVGEFALGCKRRGATVYAFEPDPIVFSALSRNLPDDAFNVALFEENRDITFYSSVRRADSSVIEPDHFDKVVEVEARTLDSFIEEHEIRNIAILKCDAEGAEPEVLMGARKALKITQMVTIDCGAERRNESTEEEVRQVLLECGFSVDPRSRERQIVIGERRT